MSPLIVADVASCITGYHPVMVKLGDAPKKYDCGHFDIYLGEYFESAIIDYVNFFNKNIK